MKKYITSANGHLSTTATFLGKALDNNDLNQVVASSGFRNKGRYTIGII